MTARRTLLIVAVLSAALVAAWWLHATYVSRVETVETSLAAAHYPADDLTLISASGYAAPYRKAQLSSKATGRLAWLGVREGARVKAGEIVARLDAEEYEAAVEHAAASTDLSRSRLVQQEASLAEARLALQRAEALRGNGFLSQSALDAARFRLSGAEAAVAAAQAEIRVAHAGMHSAGIALAQTRIVAPFDGVIVALNANVGDIVTPFSANLEAKGAVLTIADLHTLEVRAEIPEAQLTHVHIGQPCLIRLDAYPGRRLSGALVRIVPAVDRARGTVQVFARFAAPEATPVLPDMSAKLDLLERAPEASDLQAVAVVAAEALSEGTVYRVVNGRVHRTPVTTGRRFDRLIEIRSGLSPGDVVVLRPSSTLEDLAEVRTKP